MNVQKFVQTACMALVMGMVTPGLLHALEGRVVRVADGDTITVLDSSDVQHKIRLSGIDAPEKNQAFGTQSKESLSQLVSGKTVVVEVTKRDRYGRWIGKILRDGKDINLLQIQRGMAWHYKAYAGEQSLVDREIYADAERVTMKKKVGLWADAGPTPPWEFRRSRQ